MPYKDPAQRRARQKLYRQTPAGKAAAARSRANFYAKRRGERSAAPLVVDANALTNALANWRT